MARRPPGRRSRPSPNRTYPRTARLNTLLQEIIADYLERADDEDLGFLTVTGVEVDADLNVCQVFVSSFEDESADERILGALAGHRKPIQSAIGRQTKIRKTPFVEFAFDPGVREGNRIDQILSQLSGGAKAGEPAAADGDTEPDGREE